MTTIVYSVEYYNPSPIRFTGTGHVDMDYFDDDRDSMEDTEILASFYDEEAEELCRPILEALQPTLEKRNEEEWSYVSIKRREVKPEKAERIDYGPEFFWNTFLDLGNGFNPDEYGWDETDKDGNPFDWDTKGFMNQIPKRKDFLKVCQAEIGFEMRCASIDIDECSYEQAYSETREKLEQFFEMDRKMYQRDFDHEWPMMKEAG